MPEPAPSAPFGRALTWAAVAAIALLSCGDGAAETGATGAEEFVSAWAEAWSSGDVYDTVAFYAPDVEVTLAQPDLELTFSAGTWDSTTQGEGRTWLANWLERQTRIRERKVDGLFVTGDAASVIVSVDDLDTAAWYEWDLDGAGIVRQATLRWRDAHKPLGSPDPRMEPVDRFVETYLDAWGAGDTERIARLYSPDAALVTHVGEQLSGGPAIAGASGLAMRTPRLVELSAGERMGHALFVGRLDRGEPVAFVVESAGADGCVLRWAVVVTLDDGVIVSERRLADPAPMDGCHSELDGIRSRWWEGLEPPPPLELWETGVMANHDGSAITIINGTSELEGFLEWSLGRFSLAGIDPPLLDSVTFGPVPACAARAGALFDGGEGSPDLVQCTDAYAACDPTPVECGSFSLAARFSLLHELAHAWLIEHTDSDERTAFAELFALESWDDREVAWHRRAVENAADVLVWGLIDEPVRLERIGDPPCTLVAAGWSALTGEPPPVPCR